MPNYVRELRFPDGVFCGTAEWRNDGMAERRNARTTGIVKMRSNSYYYSLCVRSPFSLASDLQIIIGICDYDVTYTNNSWYSVTMMSRLRVLCRRQQQQKHF